MNRQRTSTGPTPFPTRYERLRGFPRKLHHVLFSDRNSPMCGSFLAHGYHIPSRVAVLPNDHLRFVHNVAVLIVHMLSRLRVKVQAEESVSFVPFEVV